MALTTAGVATTAAISNLQKSEYNVNLPKTNVLPAPITIISATIAQAQQVKKAEKADAKIKSTVKQNSKVRYWTANILNEYVDIGRELTFNQAVSEVSSGRSVFTVTWYEAKAVAIAAGGDSGSNNKQLYQEIDKGKENTPGYYYHYHTYNRQGGHVYFLF